MPARGETGGMTQIRDRNQPSGGGPRCAVLRGVPVELEGKRVARSATDTFVLVALFAVVLLGERPSARDWLGIGLVGLGVLVLAIK